ncbi:MAG: hypothetical protein C4523_19665 [Myxococcales bacterium]|nr:MAG: hypothetical protein C4523_19665 [Myxococcales bacterium]
MNDAKRRAARTGLQFIVAGGLTAIVNAWIVDLSQAWQVTITGLLTVAVSWAQNELEELGVPAVLKGARQ